MTTKKSKAQSKKDEQAQQTPGETKKEEGRKEENGANPEEHNRAVEVIKEVIVTEPHKELTELKLDRPKIELLKRTIAKDATDDELLMFINVCRGLGLSPFLRHVHLVKRWDSKVGGEVAAVQVGIDGFRSIAEGTGNYAGNSDPSYGEEVEMTAEIKFKEGNNWKAKTETYKAPKTATVTVRKIVHGMPYDFTATARWNEFYPGDKQGFMWRQKPYVMLGKCAEAQALRKAFPKVLGGVYVPEELDKAGTTKSPEEIRDEKFIKAKNMLKLADPKVQEEFEKKLEESDTYTEAQKKELRAIIRKGLAKVESKEEKPE